jgi:hypothetical protein
MFFNSKCGLPQNLYYFLDAAYLFGCSLFLDAAYSPDAAYSLPLPCQRRWLFHSALLGRIRAFDKSCRQDPRYEVDKILCHRTFKGRCEMLVRWAGYDESHNQWVRRSVLEEDVPTLALAYDANPSILVSRKSVPKRATKGSPDMVSPDVCHSSRST